MGGAILGGTWIQRVRKSGAGCYGNRLLSRGAVARVTVRGGEKEEKRWWGEGGVTFHSRLQPGP